MPRNCMQTTATWHRPLRPHLRRRRWHPETQSIATNTRRVVERAFGCDQIAAQARSDVGSAAQRMAVSSLAQEASKLRRYRACARLSAHQQGDRGNAGRVCDMSTRTFRQLIEHRRSRPHTGRCGAFFMSRSAEFRHDQHHAPRRQPEASSSIPSPSPKSPPRSAPASPRPRSPARSTASSSTRSYRDRPRRDARDRHRQGSRRRSTSSATRPRTCWRTRCKGCFPTRR